MFVVSTLLLGVSRVPCVIISEACVNFGFLLDVAKKVCGKFYVSKIALLENFMKN